MSAKFLLQLLHLFLLSFLTTSPATGFNIPRLSPKRTRILQDTEVVSASKISDEFQTLFYNQTIDHFNYRPESYNTFQQRYVINSKHWNNSANANAPIFAYLGAESAIDGDIAAVGFLSENAAKFQALQVYIEHRFYGESIPFGSGEKADKNGSLGYFNSAQAIADYAEIILHVKKTFNAEQSPVIVIGGSYGGMLASWFRLKYPHIALGALASSAPILYFDDITPQEGYYSVVTRDFREASETCYQTIKSSWAAIDEVASKPNGLSILSQKFKTCKPLNSSDELKDYLDSYYSSAAQYNEPPKYPVNMICAGIDGNAFGDDIISKTFGGIVGYHGNLSCYVNQPTNIESDPYEWDWQTCSEMVMPIGRENNTMFPPSPFVINSFITDCKKSYGVSPRPHWVTTYYGGHSIKLILKRFASNIIFSNGLRDPYSSAGVLENISDSIVAIHTVNGSHCFDIYTERETDPEWLIMQREAEIKTIEDWISTYYQDLSAN